MLVKHNLSTLSINNIFAESSQTIKYSIEYRNNCIFFKGKEKPINRTAFGYFYQRYKNCFSKLIIKNIGKTIEIESPFINNKASENVILYTGESVEISRKNEDDGRVTWVNIPNLNEFNETYAIEIINFMITEDGFSDVYLPNIETLPADKQALLPPEGEYKEIQAR